MATRKSGEPVVDGWSNDGAIELSKHDRVNVRASTIKPASTGGLVHAHQLES